MIAGVVNSQHELVFQLSLQDHAGKDHAVEAILDTGFDGDLTLPPALITSLGLVWSTRSSVVLATGEPNNSTYLMP